MLNGDVASVRSVHVAVSVPLFQAGFGHANERQHQCFGFARLRDEDNIAVHVHDFFGISVNLFFDAIFADKAHVVENASVKRCKLVLVSADRRTDRSGETVAAKYAFNVGNVFSIVCRHNSPFPKKRAATNDGSLVVSYSVVVSR